MANNSIKESRKNEGIFKEKNPEKDALIQSYKDEINACGTDSKALQVVADKLIKEKSSDKLTPDEIFDLQLMILAADRDNESLSLDESLFEDLNDTMDFFGTTLNFDRNYNCDYCGKRKPVAVTNYGSGFGYNRLICKDCAEKELSRRKNESGEDLKTSVKETDKEPETLNERDPICKIKAEGVEEDSVEESVDFDTMKSYNYEDQKLFRCIAYKMEGNRNLLYTIGVGAQIDGNSFEPIIRSARYTTEESFLFLSEDKAEKFLSKFRREYHGAETDAEVSKFYVSEYTPFYPVKKLFPIDSPCGKAYLCKIDKPKKKKDTNDETDESLSEGYRGCDNVEMVSHGSWADPDLVYNGYTFNYWDIEDALWNDFLDETEHKDNEAEDPAVEAEFNKYVQDHCADYLDEVIAGDYFKGDSKTWHKNESCEMKEDRHRNPLLDLRSNILDMPNGDVFYVTYKDGKLFIGSAINTGIIPEYEADYDFDKSVDANIQELYDSMIEQNPEFLDNDVDEGCKKNEDFDVDPLHSDADEYEITYSDGDAFEVATWIIDNYAVEGYEHADLERLLRDGYGIENDGHISELNIPVRFVYIYDEGCHKKSKKAPINEGKNVAIFKKVPDEQFDWSYAEDELKEFYCTEETGIVVCGNRRLKEFGDPALLKIAKDEYYEDSEGKEYDNAIDALEAYTGKAYDSQTIRGYVQGDWNTVYYPEGTDQATIDEVEAMMFGKYDEFIYDNCAYNIPHEISWKGADAIKKELSDQSGIPVEEIRLQGTNDSDDPEPKYVARSYYDKKLRGLEDSEEFLDVSELKDWVWGKVQKNVVEITNKETGNRIIVDIDDFQDVDDPSEALNDILKDIINEGLNEDIKIEDDGSITTTSNPEKKQEYATAIKDALNNFSKINIGIYGINESRIDAYCEVLSNAPISHTLSECKCFEDNRTIRTKMTFKNGADGERDFVIIFNGGSIMDKKYNDNENEHGKGIAAGVEDDEFTRNSFVAFGPDDYCEVSYIDKKTGKEKKKSRGTVWEYYRALVDFQNDFVKDYIKYIKHYDIRTQNPKYYDATIKDAIKDEVENDAYYDCWKNFDEFKEYLADLSVHYAKRNFWGFDKFAMYRVKEYYEYYRDMAQQYYIDTFKSDVPLPEYNG